MNKRIKKIAICVLLVLIIYFITAAVFHYAFSKNIWPFKNKTENGKSRYEKMFNDEYPTSFIFWKKTVEINDKLNVLEARSFEDVKKACDDKNYQNFVLLIIDPNDELEISTEDWDGIFSVVEDKVHLIYFGHKYLSYLHKHYNVGMSLNANDRSLVLFHEYKIGLTPILGIWTTMEDEVYKTNKSLLQDQIIECVEKYIIQHNKKLKEFELDKK